MIQKCAPHEAKYWFWEDKKGKDTSPSAEGSDDKMLIFVYEFLGVHAHIYHAGVRRLVKTKQNKRK